MVLPKKTASSTATTKARGAVPSRLKIGMRWFVSELVVVVAGILIALALQAWWQDRQDLARAAEYEQRILSDLRQTERTLRESITYDRAHFEAAKQLSAALHHSEPPKPDELFA
ncbi:MAG TPA: hypothetical protein VLC71_05015 [Thermomonas sp.]|nr:hypothetical protein [Thermomonas sp.]